MFFNNKSFGSVLFLMVLQSTIVMFGDNFVVVVDAKEQKKGKKNKKNKGSKKNDIKCTKEGKSNKNAEILEEYEKIADTGLQYEGVYSVLKDPPNFELRRILFQSDGLCADDAAISCLEKCSSEAFPDCTAVQFINTIIETEPPGIYECVYLNGNPTPDQFVTQNGYPEEFGARAGRSPDAYRLKSAPAIPPFNPSDITRPDPIDGSGTPGSQGFIDYLLPALGCIASQGFTQQPNLQLALDCDDCFNRLADYMDCDDAADKICTDGKLLGEGGLCNDLCGPPECLGLVRIAALATLGNAITTRDLIPGDPLGGIIISNGCAMRDIFDTQTNSILAPYTCPPNHSE